ncbi:hypothetical protein E6Q11_01665 [Candidatus Dojkabacteria bacterium]|uniref:SF3 helicase domain-containing protein n=1 Tax=Candidatus Dojkabacteria bacterium TaxID=2099670 RepID=A0A5C7J910_9BACT|nr:MAG: hypothetical protein E6Q11_01665 [Candidatus Dojkabacteria bacterium]
MATLDKALTEANITLLKYNPEKSRPVQTGDHTTLPLSKFVDLLVNGLGKELPKFPEIVACINNQGKIKELLEEWAIENATKHIEKYIPEGLEHLTLNIDTSAKRSGDARFFCTTPDELRDENTSGIYFIERVGLSPQEAVTKARAVVPRYLPRKALGVHTVKDPTISRDVNYFNTYIPASWALWKMKNEAEWRKLSDKPPADLIGMLKHIIPLKTEREYLYAWLYTSITSRAYVYLVLQGIPGLGKNRLQVLLTALHGKSNSVNGKKETFGANGSKFNGQLFESTAVWFDELKYDNEMEPRMKEYQNDTASKELKGVDATGSSDLYCSMVISNNYQRDNYILFNSRKFAPLLLGMTPLKELMSEDEIGRISDKLDESSPHFDVKYVAQVAKWILKIGPKYTPKFPRLEYQGPKFWELAHSSMSRWQKVVVVALTTRNMRGYFPGWNESKKAFQWTLVEAALRRKKDFTDKDYRDPSTVKAFFDNYRDTEGKKVFETKAFTGSILQDFWVWPIHGVSEVKGEVTVETESGDKINILDNFPEPKLVRPKGMSDFKWQKMKKEAKQKEEVQEDVSFL